MPTAREHALALNEARIRVHNEATQWLDKVREAHPNEEMSAEERAQWDRYNERLDTLRSERDALIARADEEEADGKFREAHAAAFGAGETERKERDENAEIRSFLRGERGSTASLKVDIVSAANTRNALRSGMTPAEVRSLLWDTGSVGSGVPTLFSSTLYEVMEANIALFRMPTTKIVTANGDAMSFPKVTTHAVATQVIAQGTAIGGTDPAFNKLTLDAFKYGQLCQVSSETVTDTVFDVTAFVARDLARGIARLVDADLTVGTGSGEPLGIMAVNTGSGTIVSGGSLINADYEDLVDLVYSVNDAYRASGAACWLMKDATAGQLRKLRDGAGGTLGAVLWEPSLTAGIQNGEPDRLLGYPVYTDPNVAAQGSAAKSILFGDVSSYFIRQVGSVEIDRSDEFAFNTDLVSFRGKWRVDGDSIDSTATNLFTNRVA